MAVAMDVSFTAVYRKVPEGFIAFVEELPDANTQGATLDSRCALAAEPQAVRRREEGYHVADQIFSP
jgi:hypothetical protein